jgi:hypothetical protein
VCSSISAVLWRYVYCVFVAHQPSVGWCLTSQQHKYRVWSVTSCYLDETSLCSPPSWLAAAMLNHTFQLQDPAVVAAGPTLLNMTAALHKGMHGIVTGACCSSNLCGCKASVHAKLQPADAKWTLNLGDCECECRALNNSVTRVRQLALTQCFTNPISRPTCCWVVWCF